MVAFGLIFASAAWACTVTMTGNEWFCKSTDTAKCVSQDYAGGSTAEGAAAGLASASATYQVQAHTTTGGKDCHSSGFTVVYTKAASSNGWWTGSSSLITLPAAGTYDTCAVNKANSMDVSLHQSLVVT